MNTKQIPFRYPEELEEDFEEICKTETRWSGKFTKNQALQKAVENQARLKRVLKLFTNSEKYYGYEKPASIERLAKRLEEISKISGKKDIQKLNFESDIKIKGHKK